MGGWVDGWMDGWTPFDSKSSYVACWLAGMGAWKPVCKRGAVQCSAVQCTSVSCLLPRVAAAVAVVERKIGNRVGGMTSLTDSDCDHPGIMALIRDSEPSCPRSPPASWQPRRQAATVPKGMCGQGPKAQGQAWVGVVDACLWSVPSGPFGTAQQQP